MAIPGIPQNFAVQTGNQSNLVSWSLSSGATSYDVTRSLDNVTYSALASVSGSPLATSYLDTAVTLGTQYWYRVRATSGSGSSSYTNAQSVVPVQNGEMSLGQIRLFSQQKADRVNSQFVTMTEWNSFINRAMFELYDLLVTVYEDYYVGTPFSFVANGSSYLYALPTGSNTFTNSITGATFTPPAFYKLIGVDLGLNNTTNSYVTINKFNFIDRNKYLYPTPGGNIYGVFNLQYRVMGNNIEFIPTPTAGQIIRLWQIPRLTMLLNDTDTTTVGISGWAEYIVVRAAKYALDKEESDTSKLDAELLYLKDRIETSAPNRDAGQPEKISDIRSVSGNSCGAGNGFPSGGW